MRLKRRFDGQSAEKGRASGRRGRGRVDETTRKDRTRVDGEPGRDRDERLAESARGRDAQFHEGAAIALAFVGGRSAGWATVGGAAHELPQEIGDYGVLRVAGFTDAQALLFNLASALVAVVAVLLTVTLPLLARSPPHPRSPPSSSPRPPAGGFLAVAFSGLADIARHDAGPPRRRLPRRRSRPLRRSRRAPRRSRLTSDPGRPRESLATRAPSSAGSDPDPRARVPSPVAPTHVLPYGQTVIIPKNRHKIRLPRARSIPPSRARACPATRARAYSPSDARRYPAFASPRSSRPLSLSPRSRVFGAVPGDSAFRREARKTSGRSAEERPSRPIASTRTREGTRKNIKISRPRRVARRVHRAVASASLSARIDRETGAATDRSPILGYTLFVPERARTRARPRVSTGVRFEGRSEGIGRRRARAAVETRGARGDGRFRARPETVSGARDVGVAR